MTTKLKEVKLVYVPLWIRELMLTANLDAEKILQLPKLLDILSLDDVVFYNATHNALIRSEMLEPFAQSFTPVDLMALSQRSDIEEKQLDDMLSKISAKSLVVEQKISDLYGSVNNWQTISCTSKALEYVRNQSNKHSRDDYVFDLFELDDNTYGICFSEGKERTYIQCLRETIEMLCTRYPFHEVVQTELFRHWTDILN